MSTDKITDIHLAIIPDGNRRFGKEKQGCKLKGYTQGVKVLKRVLKWFIRNDALSELTLYCFSEDNWERGQDEIDCLMEIFRDFTSSLEKFSLKEYLFDSLYSPSDAEEEKGEEEDDDIPEVIIKFCSTNLSHPNLPEDIKKSIEKINGSPLNDYKSSSYPKITTKKINICFSYDGQKEIHQAYEKALKLESNFPTSQLEIQKYLLIQSPPDIILRTSGEKRLSSFLIWQCGYSELFFLDKKWPEITKEDLDDVISEYSKREKRFGK